MIFETHQLYHIYNQGNNNQTIFFTRENYLFFLKKINQYILSHADILAWCLMPNHFHLMVYVNTLEYPQSHGVTPSHPVTNIRTLNDSIAIVLRSYTRAINVERNRSGGLFREATKAECITKINAIKPSYLNTSKGTLINVGNPVKEYPQVCFNYIHLNPVVACLVDKAEDWEFSSFSDYSGIRDGKLINKKRAEEFGLQLYKD
ncbi:MAG: hypothetical protein WCO13_11545 [Bacteroidota bacterium]